MWPLPPPDGPRFTVLDAIFFGFIGFMVLLTMSICSGRAEAHDRGDFLFSEPSGLMEQVMNRGYGIYHLDARASTFPNFRAQVWQMYGENCRLTGICFYEDWTIGASSYDLLWSLPDTWQWGDGAAGVCLSGPRYYSSRVEINWRLPYLSWLTTQSHEVGHCGERGIQEDLYFHPLTCDVSAKWTVMSCGTGVWIPTEYDIFATWNAYMPDLPAETGIFCNQTWCWAQYNWIRQGAVDCTHTALAQRYRPNQLTQLDNFCGHFSKYLDNATAVAIFMRSPGGQWFLIGHGQPPRTKDGFEGYGILRGDCSSGFELGVRPVSQLQITWRPQDGGLAMLTGDGDVKYAGTCP